MRRAGGMYRCEQGEGIMPSSPASLSSVHSFSLNKNLMSTLSQVTCEVLGIKMNRRTWFLPYECAVCPEDTSATH